MDIRKNGNMRILAISGAPDKPETALLAGLQALGHSLTLISSFEAPPPALHGIDHIHHRIHSRVSLKTVGLIRELSRAADIVHCFSARAVSNAVLAVPRNRAKIIAYRGTTGHLSKFDPSSWFSFLNPRLTAISCVSNAVRNYLLNQGVPEKKLFTIYKGHDSAWYLDTPAINLEKLFLIPRSAPVICFVGNMRPVKGADILVEAFSELDHPTAHLLLVGEVRDAAVNKSVERSKRSANIHLLGGRGDAPAIVRASDVFVMPSRAREGLPKAVIEAMILGKAIVVSDAGGMPEMITNDESGLIVSSNNTAALVNALRTVVDNPLLRERLGSAAQLRAAQQFDIRNTIKLTDGMYKKCLGR